MSNVDLIRQAYAAFAAGDIAQVLGMFTEDIEWTEAAGFVYGGTYVGGEAIVANVFQPMPSDFAPLAIAPETFLGDGDQVAALGWYSGVWRATGAGFRARFVHWWTIADDRISRFEQVVDSAQIAVAVNAPDAAQAVAGG